MQTIQFQVEDSKLETFLAVINNLKDGLFENVIVKNSNDLDSDTLTYIKTNKFQEDKVYFKKILEDFDHGRITLLSHNDVWEQIDNHTGAS